MSKKDEALKLALEAMGWTDEWRPEGLKDQAITAIREALAEQPAQQEPVAWLYQYKPAGTRFVTLEMASAINHQQVRETPLYTSPPASKPWAGLTDEQIHKMTVLMGINPEWKAEMEIVRSVVRNLEVKLREKNA